jgi:hypothetical protein
MDPSYGMTPCTVTVMAFDDGPAGTWHATSPVRRTGAHGDQARPSRLALLLVRWLPLPLYLSKVAAALRCLLSSRDTARLALPFWVKTFDTGQVAADAEAAGSAKWLDGKAK